MKMNGKKYRQELLFLSDWYKPGCVPKARPVGLKEEPDRVWTLYDSDPDHPPALPIIPVHNRNAFREDYMHDWNWYPRNGGIFDYSSRVSDRPVWVLLEYEIKD